MAYGDSTLGASHQWTFNNVLTDSIGTLTLTNTGGALIATPITRDSTHSYQTNGRDDIATVAPGTTSGAGTNNQLAVGGWFRVSQIQGPPCLVYKQGGTNGIALFIWAGNNLTAQLKNNGGGAAETYQIYSDIALTNNRVYHFFMQFSGSGRNNEFEFYIDGVKQLTNSGDVTPDSAALTAHTGVHAFGENGTSGTDVATGQESVLTKACVNGLYSQWWIWHNLVSDLTATQIREEIFAPGAIPTATISSDTQANMQLALDAFAGTTPVDAPLSLLVEAVTGDGDLALSADNITFNDRTSIHVRYEGSGTLTFTNTNGSNASRSSGNVVFVEAVDVTITVVDITTGLPIQDARVYLETSPGGVELFNTLTDVNGQVSTSFPFSGDENVLGRVRRGTTSPLYRTGAISGTITSEGFSPTIFMVRDE